MPAPTVARICLLLPTALLLLLSACRAAPDFPAPLKVGMLLPLEGERREMGYALLPALLAGTPDEIQGRPVEWVILDTHSDPETAAQRARELVADPAVLYVLGPLLPDEAQQVEPIMREARMAWIPLAPAGSGVRWIARWEPVCGVAAQNGGADVAPPCVRVRLPDDTSAYEAAVGTAPRPLSWLVWDATTFAMNQLTQAQTLERNAIFQTAAPYAFPPLESDE